MISGGIEINLFTKIRLILVAKFGIDLETRTKETSVPAIINWNINICKWNVSSAKCIFYWKLV